MEEKGGNKEHKQDRPSGIMEEWFVTKSDELSPMKDKNKIRDLKSFEERKA